jgi:hypothetical protein
MVGERSIQGGQVKRLGDRPAVLSMRAGGATVEIAAEDEHRARLLGPYVAPGRQARLGS